MIVIHVRYPILTVEIARFNTPHAHKIIRKMLYLLQNLNVKYLPLICGGHFTR